MLQARALGKSRSVWLVLPAVALAVSFAAASGRVYDIDSYWHVRLGQEIIQMRSLHGLGEGWSFGPHLNGWVTTMWLSEVIMARLHALFGWHGQLVVRVALVALTGWVLARRVLSGAGGTRPGALVFAVAMFAVAGDAQDRPALASFVFLAVVGGWIQRVRDSQGLPSVWLVGVVVWGWANLHGYWVLGPAAFGFAAVSVALDTPGAWRARWVAARPAVMRAAAGTIAGCLTPVGPALLLAPLRVAGASTEITEWFPTSIQAGSAVAMLVLVAAAAVAWSRISRPVPVGEIALVLLFGAFGMLAYRNAVLAVLLMAPIVAVRFGLVFPERAGTRPASVWVRWVAAGIVVFGFAGAVTRIVVNPALPSRVPLRALAILDGEPGNRRVANSYNVSGQILAFTGSHVRVAVDGRTDRYGAAWLARYTRFEAVQGNWKQTLALLDPTDALVPVGSPLANGLADAGWTQTVTDGPWVLLLAPGAAR